MPAPLMQIDSHDTLPAEADAVVIGAGVIGSFTAYELARRGLKVVLLEKGRVGAEQSSRNWGWCRQQNRDARELPLATKSLALWEQFSRETGLDTGFRRCGLFYLSNNEEEIERWAKWIDFAHQAGVDTHLLSSAQATERGGFSGKVWKGGVIAPTDGIADTSRAAPAAARAVMQLGGTVLQGCAARGIETSGGRVCGVVTEKGTVRTPTAILAGGAWASSFCRQLGIRLPQSSIRSTVLTLETAGVDMPDALHTADVTLTRKSDGSHSVAISGFARVDPSLQKLRFAREFIPMMLKRRRSLSLGGLDALQAGHETLSRWKLDRPTPMERMRILDPAIDKRVARLAHQRAIDLVPALHNSAITSSWAGFIDSTPDGVPVMGEAPSLPGLVLAAGFSGHGFGLSPGAGHLVADIVTGAEPIVDPAPYHPRRLMSSVWGKVAEF